MLRKLAVLAFSAFISLGTIGASTEPASAGHRDRVHFGVGVGISFGGGHHYGHHPHYYHHRRHYHHHHWRPHYRAKAYWQIGPFHPWPDYYVPIYKPYQPPIVYHKPRVRYYHRTGGSAHVEWCYARYRSYRAWDNTWQPYHGPRRQCWSPYS